MIDYQKQRSQMIERQLRTVGVLDARVLAAFNATAREDFVPDAYRALAYADIEIPLAHGQMMLNPGVQAQMVQALELKPTDNVLEVGTGSGFLTAILAQLCHRVTSIDIFEDVVIEAQQKLNAHRTLNVTLRCRDYAQGVKDDVASYDAILLNGALCTLSSSFFDAMPATGRMVAIVGAPPSMQLCVFRQVAGMWQSECLFETVAPYLVNAVMPETFRF